MSSLLQKMFGSGKGGKGPSPQDAIQKLRETETMLNKKSEFLEKKIEDELKLAKQYGTKNKRRGFMDISGSIYLSDGSNVVLFVAI